MSLAVAHIASEITPFAKTGGLAEVIGGLGPATAALGNAPYFIMPRYRCVNVSELTKLASVLSVRVGERKIAATIFQGRGLGDVPIYFIDIPEFFDRAGIYGESGRDYPDNLARFVAFCRASLALITSAQLPCDILHAHDWQTGLLPLYLKSTHAADPYFARTRSVLSIHNLGYQGFFPVENFSALGLEGRFCTPRFVEFYGLLNLLKAGIVSADAITTVSPTYAHEVLTTTGGFGLDGVLRDRVSDFVGILNGIDAQRWNPATDEHLPAHFSHTQLRGKALVKQALQAECGLQVDAHRPLIGMVNRLVDQKGVDLVCEVIPQLLHTSAQWVLLGSGDPAFEKILSDLAAAYPQQIFVRVGFDEALAHRIIAGSDFLLMPSRYEPCGLNQMYGMRYGTLPIARATGGLCDTVHDVATSRPKGTGIVFHDITAEALHHAVLRAIELFSKTTTLRTVRVRAMQQDFSWQHSAAAYVKLYAQVHNRPRSAIPMGM